MVNIRSVQSEDLYNVYSLYTDETVRKTAKNPKAVSFYEHKDWFFNRIKLGNWFILEDINNNFVGQIRINCQKEEKILNIELVKQYRKKGYGSFALKAILKKVNMNCVAYIQESNVASLNLFCNCGFKFVSQKGKYLKYAYLL